MIRVLLQDGKMIDYGDGTNDSFKHNMKKDCNKYRFSISNVGPEDAGLYQVDVEDTNVFSTGLESKYSIFHIIIRYLYQSLFLKTKLFVLIIA